ncbi:MAG: phosphoribosyltransferase [Mesorhizobium sp.]|uniref:phosphoribosyltransferase family protein n=1 Tax=Mesorhizobium sp. TaxID=1871066 RepID=UPI000FEA5A34|nr:phosphoribosyltransferase family protein [Mesorhizobium sp.]RWL80672.1 MAG: phosphoribosyltransferase [Mesorhizobium sp.]
MDETHQKGVNTSLEHNPTFQTFNGITVHYVFTRNKVQNRDGDGNPLNALKALKQYTIVPMYRNRVMDRTRNVIAKLKDDLVPDQIMPMPSSNGFVGEFAAIVAEVLEKPLMNPSFLRKKTLGEMIAEYGDGQLPKMSPSQLFAYKSELALWRKGNADRDISMKDVSPKIREFFLPLTLAGEFPAVAGQKVLIVDDLMSSGSTMASAANILIEGGKCPVTGLCFLSGLPGES